MGMWGNSVVTEVRDTPLRVKYLKKGITPLKGQNSKYHEPRGNN